MMIDLNSTVEFEFVLKLGIWATFFSYSNGDGCLMGFNGNERLNFELGWKATHLAEQAKLKM